MVGCMENIASIILLSIGIIVILLIPLMFYVIWRDYI